MTWHRLNDYKHTPQGKRTTYARKPQRKTKQGNEGNAAWQELTRLENEWKARL